MGAKAMTPPMTTSAAKRWDRMPCNAAMGDERGDEPSRDEPIERMRRGPVPVLPDGAGERAGWSHSRGVGGDRRPTPCCPSTAE